MIEREPARVDFNKMIKAEAEKYLAFFPDEVDELSRLTSVVDQPLDLRLRSTIPEGHICANSIVLSADNKELLLLKHKTLGIWVIPGGHYDIEDNTPGNTALREAREETGLTGLTQHSWHRTNRIPLDISINPIPENPKKNEGAHVHFDFSYLAQMPPGQDIVIDPNESLDYKWVSIHDTDFATGPMLSKVINKLSLLE